MIEIILILILILLYLTLFLIGFKIKDNSIVDIFWGIGFIIISIYYFYISGIYLTTNAIILIIILIWGIRLSYYILKRKIKEKREDPRYSKWRSEWKYYNLRSLLQIYILQMVLMLIISTPLYFIFFNELFINIYLLIGLLISIIGLVIEIISDNQLKKFIKSNKSKNIVFTGGLFKYSRNPNYFGESLFWLGISIIGMSFNFISIIGYIIITFLLLFVSGVPIKEKRQEKKKNWKEYKKNTSKFIPWFPKVN